MDECEVAARIIWKNPNGPISRLAVSTPPIRARMIPGKATSLKKRVASYTRGIGQTANPLVIGLIPTRPTKYFKGLARNRWAR